MMQPDESQERRETVSTLRSARKRPVTRPPRRTRGRAKDDAPLVLVVEDYQDAREMYMEFLAYSGFRVAEAQNGGEALEKAFALQPSLILMDLSMPGMDGWEATRRLKRDERTKRIPVVALTGHALAGHSETARRAGCDSFLAKPCLPDVMVAEVKRLIAAKKRDKN